MGEIPQILHCFSLKEILALYQGMALAVPKDGASGILALYQGMALAVPKDGASASRGSLLCIRARL
jgi:hypothetical protein